MSKAVIYFASGVGQKRPGIKETVQSLYRHAVQKHAQPTNTIIKSIPTGPVLETNLQRLYNFNVKLSPTPQLRINVGGDHSMAMATVAASQRLHGQNLKVIWFDAHGDINTRQTSPSGNYHGMPLAYLTGLDKEPHKFAFLTQKLDISNILYLGIRDLDDGEKQVIKQNHIAVIKSREINESPTQSTYKKISNFVGNNPVHISFDVDGIDPTEMPSTGTTAPRGVHMAAIKPLLDKLITHKNVVCLDIVELNLALGTYGEKQLSMANFYRLFNKYL